MKIWNGYLKVWIDLKKSKIHKATWEHGFISGFMIGCLIFVMTITIMMGFT